MTPVRFLRELSVVLGLAAGAVFGLTRWVVIPWVVEGPSMQPTLEDGDRVLVNLWSARRGDWEPGDVVVLVGPSDEALVKRVAPEPYPGKDRYPAPAMETASPLEPSYVVLGDNPAASLDSRSFGRVPRHRIRGRIAWRYWPVSRMGSIR